MRASSAKSWRQFLVRYGRLHVYTVDPGAHAMASELVPLIRDVGRLGTWFAEGWSAANEPECRPAAELPQSLLPCDGLIIGSQTDFSRTQSVLKKSADAGAATIFVFDHWKNYGEHFYQGQLADTIVVPDEVARGLLKSALGAAAKDRIQILPHLAIEASADRIFASGVATQPGFIALLLDPTEPEDGLGYDWRSALVAISNYAAVKSWERLLIKPHPRQDVAEVAREVAALRRSGVAADICLGGTERLIARAEEVWGMTTIALNVALAVGKPIRSFQIGRNDAGVRASNPHIEPFVIS